MHPFHIRVVTHQLCGDQFSILAGEFLACVNSWTHGSFGAEIAGAVGRMQDVFRDAGNFAWHAIETGEIVDIYEHQSLRRFQHIYAIEVKAEDLTNSLRQFEHLAANWYLLLDYCPMQGG